MARDLTNARILLTGATSGIGKALALQLLAAGARLTIVGRNAEKLAAFQKECTSNARQLHMVTGDVANPDDRQRMVESAVEKFGGLDGLINNAGIASWGHFAGSDESIMRQIMEVNFFAPIEMIRLALPHLTQGVTPFVCNVSSMTGRKAMPAWPEYSASKHALCGMTEAFRGEFARFGIDVVLIIPGLTRTNLQKDMLRCEGKAKLEFDKGMEPAYVAEKIVRAIRKGAAETVIGSDAKWMLRMQRWLPRLTDRLIAKKVKKLYAASNG